MNAAQLDLLTPAAPALPPGIDLRCADVAAVLADAQDVALVHADPPWSYERDAGGANPANHYAVLDYAGIVDHLERAYDAAAPGARLVLWTTWPLLYEWREASRGMRWRYVTGGAWTKTGSLGVGYHWRGHSEPILIYRRPGAPAYRAQGAGLRNAYTSARTRHSEKPAGWLEWILRTWLPPGGQVLDLYAGLAPLARAAARSGRRYLGAEIDPVRWRAGVDRLALDRSRPLFSGTAPRPLQATPPGAGGGPDLFDRGA